MTIKLLKLNRYPILKQLQIEEAIYRSPNSGNWVVINKGTPDPTIIVGVTGRADKLVHLEEAKKRNIDTIKRFTGGGTVVTDDDTLFITFIFDQEWFKTIYQAKDYYPRDIMKWSEHFYNNVFNNTNSSNSNHSLAPFSLMEHDYSYGTLKFGGNAQSFSRLKFIHHTSFLYDFKQDNMSALLKHPDKEPEYRKNRDHLSFLCKLKDRFKSQDEIADRVEKQLTQMPKSSIMRDDYHNIDDIKIQQVSIQDALQYLDIPHYKSNQIYDHNNLNWKDLE
ncbi:hypothetical protein CYY_000474 [Polysphondylium violaceum]|uniref:BPL/LPL catalytic domain-containing protein n=1 Tax=Polysphondylium violaceum TaxID=133409 RepID=A0A8J4Q3I0_9MYCE|nr:hypothetical protein CYY_000474 [Polysphondylium violaceum]